ncbi:MBL fold metallo-hydrolase [Actinorugispora endophytica]|uniref:Cft2 family RNA processing exonuclease n=1 Tax=Actinorugispora endophytica TaxID=1605990 RepID=A0A4R6V1A6_9ACTN|nr:MBL fold metallo-hydrolase [Actinorugispora endophytica]TDQ53771.1 Cft2 family RNA processing exonuclease [Actinorugispora endophytica]
MTERPDPALRLVASVVLARPTFGGPERTAAELADGRPAWLLGLLARFPALRDGARAAARRPLPPAGAPGGLDEAEALCRLLLHPAPGVADAAAALVEPLFPPVEEKAPEDAPAPASEPVAAPASAATGRPADTGASPRSNPAKRLKWLERSRDEQRRKASNLSGRLLNAERERDRALAEARAERARAEELADQLDSTAQRLDFAEADRTDPRVLAGRLAGVWEAAEPGRAEADRAGRDPRPRGHGVPVEGAARTRFRSAAERAGIAVEGLLAALRALAAPEAAPAPSPPRPSLEVGAQRELRVTQLGGGTSIGGSCVLVEAGSTRLLVDAGTAPRRAWGDSGAPSGIAAVDGLRLDAVVVTHAHNDHGGYVPALLAGRARFPVVATPETAELLPTMWRDSARVNGRDAARLADYGASGSGALYGVAEVAEARRRLTALPVGVEHSVGDVTVELFPAGHILGAAGVVVRAGDRRAVVTGDISGFAQETVGGYALPESARGADLLVVETTCCGMDLGPRENGVDRLVSTVARTCERGGRVLIPAMSLGRAQELAGIMRRRLPEVPVLLDGMAALLARQFEQATAGGPAPLSILGGNVARVDPRRRAEEVASLRGGVVISPAGSLAGGPVVEWARAILPDPDSAVLISGHTDEEAPGGRLERLRDGDGRRFTLDGPDGPEEVEVRARVADMRLSAHADRPGLLEIVREVDASRVSLVHGVPFHQKEFGRVLTAERRRWALGQEGVPVAL